ECATQSGSFRKSGGNTHRAQCHGVIQLSWQADFALRRTNLHQIAVGQTQLGQRGGGDGSRRGSRRRWFLPRNRTARQGTAAVERYIRHTPQTASSRQNAGSQIDLVAQTRFHTGSHDRVTNRFGGFVVETIQLEQIAQYAQNLPGRTGIAHGSSGALEALYTA